MPRAMRRAFQIVSLQIHPPQPHQAGGGQAVFGLQIALGAAVVLPDGAQHKGRSLRVYPGGSLPAHPLRRVGGDLRRMVGHGLFDLGGAAEVGAGVIRADGLVRSTQRQ